MIPFYNKRKISFSRIKRKEQTYGEMKLWSRLKNKQLLSYKFRRQYVINNYVVDFYCIKLKLIIEIDGSSHNQEKYEYDKSREIILRKMGNNVIRFTEYEVRKGIDSVLQTIINCIENLEHSTSPTPPARRGKEQNRISKLEGK